MYVMSKFYYKAKDKAGNIINGNINSGSISEAALHLEKDGLIIIEINEAQNSLPRPHQKKLHYKDLQKIQFSTGDKLEFFNSFYFMYNSGLSLQQVFDSIVNSTSNKKIKILSQRILTKIESGYSLKEAVDENDAVLGRAYSTLLTAGEQSGKLENILSKIIKSLNREVEVKKNIISSLTYPAFIFCLAFAVLLFFKFFVLKVFASMGDYSSLSVSSLLVAAIIKIVIIYAVLGAVITVIILNKTFINKIYNFLIKVPVVSGMFKEYLFSNFFAVTALAYEAGIPAANAIELGNSVINISDIHRKINQAVKRIYSGCEITTAFKTAGVFSSYAISQVSSGEKSGDLDKTMMVVSDSYEKQLDTSLKSLLKLVEPIMIIIIGIFVGYILYTGYTGYYQGIMNMF